MSKPNKANKNNYDQAGRLAPDELARERSKQANITAKGTGARERARGEREPSRPRSAPEE
jgi:hypothetical protein